MQIMRAKNFEPWVKEEATFVPFVKPQSEELFNPTGMYEFKSPITSDEIASRVRNYYSIEIGILYPRIKFEKSRKKRQIF